MSTRQTERWTTLAERLQWARDRAGISQQEVADGAGVSRVAIGQVESGSTLRPAADTMKRIATKLKVSLEWLIDGTGSPDPLSPLRGWSSSNELSDDAYGWLPQVNLKLHGGPGGGVMESSEELDPLPFKIDFLRKAGWTAETHKVMRVKDTSMEPIFRDGGLVVVDTRKGPIRSGEVYAIWWDGEAKIKRLQRTVMGGIQILSDNASNPANRPIELMPYQVAELQIIGRVVYHSGLI